jgi:hypothetical protein
MNKPLNFSHLNKHSNGGKNQNIPPPENESFKLEKLLMKPKRRREV